MIESRLHIHLIFFQINTFLFCIDFCSLSLFRMQFKFDAADAVLQDAKRKLNKFDLFIEVEFVNKILNS